MGVQTFARVHVLATKSKYRKNLRLGRIPLLPCLCREPKIAARALCSGHFWWIMTCESSRVGGPLFPKTSANSTNRQITAAMGNLGYEQGRRYSPNAFRRGATEEINDSGSTIAAIIKSCAWAEAGFKYYMDLQRDEAISISLLLLGNAYSNS